MGWNSLLQFPSVMTLLQWGFVIVAISLGVWSIVWLRSYFREDADGEDERMEMLTQFRELYQQGGLSDDEFRLIRSRLSHRDQTTSVREQSEPKATADNGAESTTTDSPSEALSQPPEQHATTEDLEKSEGMSDSLRE